MTKKRIDYSGKKVNIGIDVHKKTYSICCVLENQVVKIESCFIRITTNAIWEGLNFHLDSHNIECAPCCAEDIF